MDTKTEIIKIWHECFPADSKEWIDMYFRNAYQPECAMALEHEDKIVSSLLLQPYTMTFHGEYVGASYVSGAATRPRYRGNGFMKQLMKESLTTSYSRGDMLCTLIPANTRLYYYYSRLGFATVFYNTLLRYTSVHVFPVENDYTEAASYDIGFLYSAFTDMMQQRHCCIQHTEHQFRTILDDNRLCGGQFTAIADSDGQVAAMAWAIPENESRVMRVVDILSKCADARNAVLHQLQMQCPKRPLTIMDMPHDSSRIRLTPRGMARIIRPDQALSIMARIHSGLRANIRVTDDILPANNAIYRLSDGNVELADYFDHKIKLDLDVTIDVLTAILFSSPHIGKIMGLPSERPFMSLMLD